MVDIVQEARAAQEYEGRRWGYEVALVAGRSEPGRSNSKDRWRATHDDTLETSSNAS